MNSTDINILEHIQVYCSEIKDTVARFGDDLEVFLNDKDYQASISMKLLNIGELANGLSKEFKEDTKVQVPWGLISGLRNHVAHGYHKLDFSEIFDTAINDIPFVANFCEEQLLNTQN